MRVPRFSFVNSLPKWLTARRLIILAVYHPALLLLTVDWLQWRSASEYRASFKWVIHSRAVLSDLELLLSYLNDAETGQRGFLLTHKDSYLRPYENASTSSEAELHALRQLTADNPAQQKNLDLLEPLVKAKFAELAQTVALEKNRDHDGAIKVVMTDFGQNTMDQIRAIITRMHGMERSLLQQREEAYQHSVQWNAEISGALITLGLGFASLSFSCCADWSTCTK